MKTSTYTQAILCEGVTFQDAVDKFNEVMMANRALKPTFERVGESFLVFVNLTDRVPETIVEAKELKGIRHTCQECGYCERDLNRFGEIDKRKLHGRCSKDSGRRIRIDSSVCDTFYLERQDERKEG